MQVVDTAASSWCVLDEQQPAVSSPASSERAAAAPPRPGKLLSISLALPPLTLEELQYKKGAPSGAELCQIRSTHYMQ